MKDKKFDAVKMMRDIRDKLTKRYLENPDLEKADLQKIRKKYKIKTKAKIKLSKKGLAKSTSSN